MLWVEWFLLGVLAVAAISLIHHPRWRRDLLSGRPDLASLITYTGIGSRLELERHCGPADENLRFTLPPEALRTLPRRRWAEFIGTPYDDLGIAVVALLALQVGAQSWIGQTLVWICALYLAVNFWLGGKLLIEFIRGETERSRYSDDP